MSPLEYKNEGTDSFENLLLYIREKEKEFKEVKEREKSLEEFKKVCKHCSDTGFPIAMIREVFRKRIFEIENFKIEFHPNVSYIDLKLSECLLSKKKYLRIRYNENGLKNLCKAYRAAIKARKRFELIQMPSQAKDPEVMYNLCPNLWCAVYKLQQLSPEVFGYEELKKGYLQGVQSDCSEYKDAAKLLVKLFENCNKGKDLSKEGFYAFYAPHRKLAVAAAKYTKTPLKIFGDNNWNFDSSL